ncbi:sarcotoxin II-1-like [Haematobia irritans]|uniref:sarcotoxin II-1-like n=1 Tax=Haematobia irritans TaxID=7368 RepID=UPI003F4FC591
MKCVLVLGVCIASLCMVSISSAYPQRVYVQKLPYYPPPTKAPRPIRVRRSPDNAPLSKGVSIVTNSASGNLYSGPSNRVDAKVTQSQTNFPSGKIAEGSSGSIDWSNAHGVGASISRDINKGVSDTLSKSVNLNLFNNDRNRLDAIYSQSTIRQDNGFKFGKESGLLNWSNSGGHGANAGISRFEGFGKQASVGANTNLFKSNDGNTRLDAYGSGSKWLSGPFENRQEFGFGLTGSHSFRG